MKKLNPEELTLIVSLYRSLKSNPKEFKLADSARKHLIENVINLKEFDVDRTYGSFIAYYGYSTSFSLGHSLPKNSNGEDHRAVEKAINAVKRKLAYDTIKSIRAGNVPDKALVEASYIQIGISYNLIPLFSGGGWNTEAWEQCNQEDGYNGTPS